MIGRPRVSVAVPLYNEEDGITELLWRVGAVLDGLPGGPHEIVLVDDGSTDRTPALLEEAAARDPRLVVVSLSRNFGHQAALSAALDYAGYEVKFVQGTGGHDSKQGGATLPEGVPSAGLVAQAASSAATVIAARQTTAVTASRSPSAGA